MLGHVGSVPISALDSLFICLLPLFLNLWGKMGRSAHPGEVGGGLFRWIGGVPRFTEVCGFLVTVLLW